MKTCQDLIDSTALASRDIRCFTVSGRGPSPPGSSPIVDYKQVAMLSHMGGSPAQTALFDWLQLDPSEWKIIITSPGLFLPDVEALIGLEMTDGQAVLLEKKSILA